MQLNEFSTVLDQFDHLLDLFEATAIAIFNIRDEELEEVLAHFVVDDGLARHFFLLNRELV